MPETDDDVFLNNLAVLAAGAFAGLLVALAFCFIPFDFSGDLVRARKLGVISRTILDGYPKKRDIVNYAAVFGFPVLFGVGGWFIRARKALPSTIPAPAEPCLDRGGKGWRRCLAAVGAFYLLASLACYLSPAYDNLASLLPWLFLGEEGANLAWAQSLLNGGIYGRDINCLYGPMLIYPLAWSMKLLGAGVSTLRLYTYCLNLAAYGIVLAFLYTTLRSKTLFVVAALMYLAIFSPLALFYPNATYLRVVLGILPILLAYRYLEVAGSWRIVVCGVVLGQSVLFSQEVGLCAILALASVLVVSRSFEKRYRELAADLGMLAAGAALSASPLLGYFQAKGVLGDVVSTLVDFPRLQMLGFQALPFPDFWAFLRAPLTEGAPIFYSTIFVYIASALYLVPQLFQRRHDPRTLLRLALLVFGLLLFRTALSRSDEFHAVFVIPPAVLLLFLFTDDALAGFGGAASLRRATRAAIVALSLATLALVTLCNYNMRIWLKMAPGLAALEEDWLTRPAGVTARGVPRFDVTTNPKQAEDAERIGDFLKRNTRRGEYVYFFPTDAAYYFLFDCKNPTRYNHSIFAATTQLRLELVDRLERTKPRFVVYNLGAVGIDQIPAVKFEPEVDTYLREKYRPVEQGGGYLFLKRIGT